ncbi:MAG: phenylalanine--tRNA ligase subunit beta [Pseudohongiellaceae bacterium]|nr:phenylalanine--tRNA ligase subunit beta [Pseudohongiellaceae bacterium]
MIFSEQWVREWVNPSITTEQLVEQLTMAGLEVDACGPVAAEFTNIVVAEVLSVEPHPDADKLRVCQVNDGSNTVQVVCGAPNVRAGMRVPFAQVGARLVNPADDSVLKIKKAKLRGVESNGMLCSSEELGISESADGLLDLPADAPIGTDIREYLHLDDKAIELDLTPNRGDCLGISGISREIAALNDCELKPVEIAAVAAQIQDTFPVKISAQSACPRYLGRVVRDIDVAAPTPLWMQEKLRRSGIRSIDIVVDITNYVLLELGQPMHAFDLQQLSAGIDVRMATVGEKITLLDGKELTLAADDLVIADGSGPLALAGIMGGENSGVGQGTKDVFLECAYFSALALAGRARRYGLHTDASHRYERGVDYKLQPQAMERATALLVELAGGKAGPVIEAEGELPVAPTVALSFAKVSKVLGVTIARDQIMQILKAIGLIILSDTEEQVEVEVPSFRFDISLDVDLIEEIARVYGYNNLPKTSPTATLALGKSKEAEIPLVRFKNQLAALGYQEVITYSFVEPALLQKIQPEIAPVPLQNPISNDLSVMRTSLWPGLINALKHNANRQQERVRLFECGQVFLRTGDVTRQPPKIAGLIYGELNPQLWCDSKKGVDFFDIKGDLESILELSMNCESYQFVKGSHPALHSGQCAAIEFEGREVGLLGALNPALQRDLGISDRVYLFELDLATLQAASVPKAAELSKFPEVSRDLAIVIDEAVTGGEIMANVRENAGSLLVDLRIFDVYQGDAMEKSKKSIALGLTLQHPSRTLSDEDINAIIDSCVNGLEAKFNAKLRN